MCVCARECVCVCVCICISLAGGPLLSQSSDWCVSGGGLERPHLAHVLHILLYQSTSGSDLRLCFHTEVCVCVCVWTGGHAAVNMNYVHS